MKDEIKDVMVDYSPANDKCFPSLKMVIKFEKLWINSVKRAMELGKEEEDIVSMSWAYRDAAGNRKVIELRKEEHD